ncbi:conserved exported hypothetical protein [uncultured Eubacteriales bacterium]|uniref:Flavodoxin domain-containing protein n=1 Tax=uncultured Eubacteriales bacterium TaxID=172733 RepID=A0A212KCW9_9FIRM|nr:conserved exported hypothetical protein [uncultured Eubacteriales bacterium]
MVAVYILIGVLLVMLVLGLAAMIFFKLAIGTRDSWRNPEEKIVGDGAKKALLLYQPSNGKHNVSMAMALAELAAGRGYTVTVNHPSEKLTYDPAEYDLLIYGSAVYMGETSKALRNYIQAHPVTGKDVLIFVTGLQPESPEGEALKLLLPDANRVSTIKVTTKETQRLLDFAKLHIPEGEPRATSRS